jgi:hypothetical protein
MTVWICGRAEADVAADLARSRGALAGGPLAHQLADLGAGFAGQAITAPRYRMTVLHTAPPKPAITPSPDGAPGRR